MGDPLGVTPSVRAIICALLRTQDAVSGLQVIVKPDCRGRTWLVDTCCRTIYLSGSLPADRAAEALADALDTLMAEMRRAGPGPEELLAAAIPTQRSDTVELGWAGTG